MALLTKGQVRTAIRQAIDDANANRWQDTNLDVLVSIVQDTLWQQVLDSFPWFLSQTDTAMTNSSGVYTLSGLTKRLYRIQKVTRASDGLELQPKLFNEKVPQAAYYLLGNTLVTDPVVQSANLSVTYAYLPTKFIDLTNDSTVLEDWPEGHEAALIYTTAAFAITKGDAESMQQLARLADMSITALVEHIARRYPVSTITRTPSIKFSTIKNLMLGEPAQRG